MRVRFVCLALAWLALGAAGCSSSASEEIRSRAQRPAEQPAEQLPAVPGGVSETEIVLGISAAFQGPSRALGIELYRGAMAYLAHVNANGGVRGRRLVLRTYDDGYDPLPAIENTIRLVDRDDVFLLFNYVGTPTVTRVLPLLKKHDARSLYLFFPFTGAQPHREPPYEEFVFNLRASYRQETAGLVDRLVSVGRPRIAVFYQADAYGRSGWDGVRRALARHGHEIAGEATYRRGTPYAADFGEQVRILREAGADAIIAVGAYEACAGFIRDARDAGWEVPIANLSFVGSESLLELLLETGRARGVDYTRKLINSQVVPSYEDLSLPAVRQYRELMERYDPAPPEPYRNGGYRAVRQSFVSFEGFLNAKVLVEILERLGDEPARERLREVVHGLPAFDIGIGAEVRFGPGRHQGLDQVYFTTVRGERFVPLEEWEAWRL